MQQILKFNEAIVKLNIVSRLEQNVLTHEHLFQEVSDAMGNIRSGEQIRKKYETQLCLHNAIVIETTQMYVPYDYLCYWINVFW